MPRWTGTIAYLETPTVDGQVLRTPKGLRTADSSMPRLILPKWTAGTVDSMTVDGTELRAEGDVPEGLLKPGEQLPVSVDLADVSWEWLDTEGARVFTEWRVRAITVCPSTGGPSWPGAHIRLADA